MPHLTLFSWPRCLSVFLEFYPLHYWVLSQVMQRSFSIPKAHFSFPLCHSFTQLLHHCCPGEACKSKLRGAHLHSRAFAPPCQREGIAASATWTRWFPASPIAGICKCQGFVKWCYLSKPENICLSSPAELLFMEKWRVLFCFQGSF